MGQYFDPVILDAAENIVAAIFPRDYGPGEKLAGHTRADTPFLTAVETLLALDGGARLVWAGDYNGDPGSETNLYYRVHPHQFVRFAGLIDPDERTANTERPVIVTNASHPYICNADKREYIDKQHLPIDDYEQPRNPLPALTAEGGRSAGRLVGSWARDRIYLSPTHPGDGWTEVASLIWT